LTIFTPLTEHQVGKHFYAGGIQGLQTGNSYSILQTVMMKYAEK